MPIEEILIVRHDKVCFGIPTAMIAQILRVPELTPLALSPREVRGLCAVGGNISTVMDMNLLLGLPEVDQSRFESRVLSLNGALSASSIIVSEVLVSTFINPERIEYIEKPHDPVIAIYHHESGLIQIIDVERLLCEVKVPALHRETTTEKNEKEGKVVLKRSEYDRYLLFRMGKEHYGMEIENLREILSAHAELTPIAGAKAEIAGMMSLREDLLVVADLRRYYGFEPRKSEKNRILVVEMGNKTMGLIIDEIIDIREYLRSDVDLFAENRHQMTLSGVIHDPEQLISLIGRGIIERIIGENESIIVSNESHQKDEQADTVMEVVVFRLGEEEYAIDIEGVAEIIDMTPVTPIADAPENIDGVINIRGQIVTIGSLHKRLGIPPSKAEDQKIVVCQAAKGRIGFFVNSVSDVKRVSKDEIRDNDEKGDLFSRVLYFDEGKRLVLLFDLDALNLTKGTR